MEIPLLVSFVLEIEYKILPFQNQGIEYKILPSLSVKFAFTLKEDREIEYKILPFPHRSFPKFVNLGFILGSLSRILSRDKSAPNTRCRFSLFPHKKTPESDSGVFYPET